MSILQRRLAIDLGTSTTRVYVRKKGIAVQEPSIVARSNDDDKIIAIGAQAEAMLGRQTEDITVSKPLVNGVIADFNGTQKMLRYFISQASGRFHLSQPEAMITIPSGATSTEQRAIIDAGKQASLRNVYLIPAGVAAALGAGLPIIEPRGRMIIDIGSGTTEVAVLSLGGVVASRSIRVGGDQVNEIIARSIKRNFGVIIGNNTAEEVKRLIGTLSTKHEATMTINGRTTTDGQPQTLELHSDDIRPYIEASMEKIILATRNVLEKTPPDLVSDIVEQGVTLSGGGSYTHGIEDYLSRKLHIEAELAQDPLLCSVKGAFLALTHLADYKRSLLGL